MIVCGTDLSPASDSALQCAAAFARKQNKDLLLVHVLDHDQMKARNAAELRLEADAKTLRHDFDISVETSVVYGHADEQLLALANQRAASLLVVGAEGSRKRRLASVPERLCQAGTVPVLVARATEGLEAWSRHQRPLRVLVGTGLGDTSRCALRYVSTWSDLALTVAHVAWPFGEHYRLGVSGPMPLDHLRPEVHHQLMGDLGRWASHTPCAATTKLKVIAGWGRVDSHLAQLAHEKEADLLVVGSHQRNLAERVWLGSISRSALHEAACNVLCVPQAVVPTVVDAAPRVVVIPTDFSRLGDRAIAAGYALVERGSTVHLVHVVTGARDAEAGALAQLQARIPAAAESRGISTVLHVTTNSSPWLAIWQYASRVNANLVCMAKHSREGLATLLLGSQAGELLRHSRVPVVFVPPDREA